jgi:hypothetical protein
MRASSDGWSVTVRGLVRPGCLLTARRYGTPPVGIHGISHTVFGTSHHCMDSVRQQTRSFVDVRTLCHTPDEAAMEQACSLPAIPCVTCVREHRRGPPLKSHPCAREGRAPPGHGGGHGRRPSAPHAGTPGNGGPASTRPAPRCADSQSSSFPVRQVAARAADPRRPTRFPLLKRRLEPECAEDHVRQSDDLLPSKCPEIDDFMTVPRSRPG